MRAARSNRLDFWLRSLLSISRPTAFHCRVVLSFTLLALLVVGSGPAARAQERESQTPQNGANSEEEASHEKIEAFLRQRAESTGARWFRYFHVPPEGASKAAERREKKSLDPSITLNAYNMGSDGSPSPKQVFDEFWERVVKPAAAQGEHGVVVRDAIHDPNGEWGRKLIEAAIQTLDTNGDNSPKAIKALIKQGAEKGVSKEHAALMWFARDLLVRQSLEPAIARLKQMHPGMTFDITILDSGSFGSIGSDIDKTLHLTVWKDDEVVDDPFGSGVVMGGDINRFIQLVYEEFDKLGFQYGATSSISKSMDTEFFPSDTLPERFARAATHTDSDTPINRAAARLKQHFDALQRNPGPAYQFSGTVIAQVTGRTVEQDASLQSQIDTLRKRRDLIDDLASDSREALVLDEALASTHSPAVLVEEVDGKIKIESINVAEFLEKNNLTVRYSEQQAVENAIGNYEKLIHKVHYIIDAEGAFHADNYDTYLNDIAKYGDRSKKDTSTFAIKDDGQDKPAAFGEFDRRFGPANAKDRFGLDPPNMREYTFEVHRQTFESALKKLYAMAPGSPDAARSGEADLKLYWATNLANERVLAIKADPELPNRWGFPEGVYPHDRVLQDVVAWIEEHEPERFGDIANLPPAEQQKAKVEAAKRLHVEAEERAAIVLSTGNLQEAMDMWLKQGPGEMQRITEREAKKIIDLSKDIEKLKAQRHDDPAAEKARQVHLAEMEARMERARALLATLTNNPGEAEAMARMSGRETARRLFLLFKHQGDSEAYDRMVALLPAPHQEALRILNGVWEVQANEREKARIAAENRIDLRRIGAYGRDVARRLGWAYAEQFGVDTAALSYVPKHADIYDDPNHPARVLGRFLRDSYVNIGSVDSGLAMIRTMQMTEGMPYEQRMQILADAAIGEFISGMPAAGPVWATWQGYQAGDPKMMAGGAVNGASELARMWLGIAAESLDDALIQAGQVGRVQMLNRLAGLGHTATLWLGLARTAVEIAGHEAFAPVKDHFFQLVYKGYVDAQEAGWIIRAGTREVDSRIPVTPIIEPERGQFWFLYLKPKLAQWYVEDLWRAGELEAAVALFHLAGLDENLDREINAPVMIDLATDYGKMADAAERRDLGTGMLPPKLADKAELARRNVVAVWRRTEALRQATWQRINADRELRRRDPGKPNLWMLAARENLGLYFDEQFQSQAELLYRSLLGMREARETLRDEAARTWQHWQATAPSYEGLESIREGLLDVMSPRKNYEARLAELKKAADEAGDLEWAPPTAMLTEWMARSTRSWLQIESEEDIQRRQKIEYLQRQVASLGVFVNNDYMTGRTPTESFRLEEAAEWYGGEIRGWQKFIRELPTKRTTPGGPKKSELLNQARERIAQLQSEYSLLMEAFSQADRIVAPKIAQLYLMRWLAGEAPFDNDVHLALKFIWQDADTQQRIRRKVTDDLVRGRRLIPQYRSQVEAMASLLDAEMAEIAIEHARLTQDRIQQAFRESLAAAEALAEAREKPDRFEGKLELHVDPYLELTDDGVRVHVDTRADHDIYRALDVQVKNAAQMIPYDKIESIVDRQTYDRALNVTEIEEEDVLFAVLVDAWVKGTTPPQGHEDKKYKQLPKSNGHLLLVPGRVEQEDEMEPEDEVVLPEAEPGTPILRLTRIQGSARSGWWNTEEDQGKPCLISRHVFDNGGQLEVGVNVTELPLEIVPGQPFTFSAEVFARENYPPGTDCGQRYCSAPRVPEISFHDLDHSQTAREFASANGVRACCREVAALQSAGSVGLTASYVPEETETARFGTVYPYQLELFSDGAYQQDPARFPLSGDWRKSLGVPKRFRFDDRGFLENPVRRGEATVEKEVRFGYGFTSDFLGWVSLTYELLRPDEPYLTSVPACEIPPLVTSPQPTISQQQIPVPEVVGDDPAQARTAIEDAGLVPRVVGLGSAPTPEEVGKVASVNPIVGTAVAPGTTVEVRVWGPYPQMQVPEVVGGDPAQARTTIEDAGLVPRVVGLGPARTPDDAGKVGSVNPGAGATVAPGTTVEVGVWGPYPQTPVPADLSKLGFWRLLNLDSRTQDGGA